MRSDAFRLCGESACGANVSGGVTRGAAQGDGWLRLEPIEVRSRLSHPCLITKTGDERPPKFVTVKSKKPGRNHVPQQSWCRRIWSRGDCVRWDAFRRFASPHHTTIPASAIASSQEAASST